MTGIQYIKGDATKPVEEGNKIIAHICNDVGGWGKGFVMAISRRWKQPELEYRKWYNSHLNFSLGSIQMVFAEENIWVANMIAQKDIVANSKGESPIRYDALEKCLVRLCKVATEKQASIHMPRIGTGLAGGKWELIEPLIIQELTSKGIKVFVYDLE